MRLKSNARWMDLPGVECAYQSIGAPSPVDATLNVAHDHRMVGKYTATPGVLPAWSAAVGWTFNGVDQYLMTNVFPSSSTTLIARWTGFSESNNHALLGSYQTSSIVFAMRYGGYGTYFYQGNATNVLGISNGGVGGIAGLSLYRSGLYVASVPSTMGVWTSTVGIMLGAMAYLLSPSPTVFSACGMQSLLLASRTFTPAEMWLCSQQMKYCEQNPDWNAWARRRQYFYAPSAAAIRWPGVGRGGPIGGSPGIRGSAQ